LPKIIPIDGHVDCSIFFADIDHDHTKPITKTNDLKDVLKKPFIKELINMNRKISNERILHALASAKLPQVSQQQLNNLKSRLKNTNPKTGLQKPHTPHLKHLIERVDANSIESSNNDAKNAQASAIWCAKKTR